MPQEPQLSHRNIRQTNLPYRSNASPIDTEPHFVTGSTDLLTSINGYCERRFGFANTVETTPTAFNNLQRTFQWDRFDGTFFVMFCDINASNQAQVYKYQVGSDTSAVSIYTDTGSSTPFDFVVSNNTLYFSNGHVAKKWDPANGVSNWGITIGSVNNVVGPTTAGSGVLAASGVNWVNVGNVTSAVNYATASLGGNHQTTDAALATSYGFSIPAGNIITGFQVTVDVISTDASLQTQFSAVLNKLGTGTGLLRFATPTTTSPTTLTFGSSSDLWGATWIPNDVNQSGFGAAIVAGTGSSPSNVSIRNVRITVYSLGGPSISVSGSGGGMTATAGYQYVFCYGNSNTGHISSPSPVSSSTGVFTNKANVSVTLTASLDPQVNQIRVFRTTDGGGGTYFELPTSPYANTSTNITDSAADTSLNISSIAPTATFNDPPPPFQGMVYFAGRIWGFVGNKVWFSGLEEINQGVPEESFPSGVSGNFWSFDQPVQGQGVAGNGDSQTLGIFCGGRLYAITGNTLDTFRRFTVSQRRGCRNRTCVSSLGGMVAWLDSANQIWATDGSTLQEISLDIRPDLVGLNPASCDLTFHVSGRFHWLVFSTGTKVFVYDLDTNQWMPPWSFAAQYISSGETSPGNYQLMGNTATKALQMSTAAHNDNGATYQPIIKLSLMSLVPDFGKRFSYVAMGIYDQPSRTGIPDTFQVTNNNKAISDVLFCQDDDPTNSSTTYTSIVSNLQPPETTYNRIQGQNLTQWVYKMIQPSARWLGFQVKLANLDQTDNIYEMFLAYKELGGR